MAIVAAERTAFDARTEPYRRELLEHCYRMVGSAHEAEDLVQEVYLRAWRGFDRFEGRASLRTWLHKIASTTCLTALDRRRRRDLPAGLGGPTDDPTGALPPGLPEDVWLEPLPDADPAGIADTRTSVRLALVAAMQHLPARQRAALLLRDVLSWRAAEVAELLGTSTVAVNSMLQRARAHLADVAPTQDELTEPGDPRLRALLDRYSAAFEAADLPAIRALLTDDVAFEMPPYAMWARGPEDTIRLLEAQCPAGPGDTRMIPTRANGGPAFAVYLRGHAHAVQTLTVTPRGVSRIVVFLKPELLSVFGFSAALGDP